MEKKQIDIDPSFLNIGSSGGSKSRSLKQKNITAKKHQLMSVKSNNVKELLLQKLKEYKKNKSKKSLQPSQQQAKINPDFLEKIRKKKNKSEQNVSMNEMNNIDIPPSSASLVHEPTATVIQLNHQTPPYSNLKNTSKPTFREWKMQEASIQKPENDKIEVEVKKRFNVGKNKTMKKIGILLKNTHTKRQNEESKTKWKRTNLKTVKNYLKKQNLIRYGSSAPTELMREIYEVSQMCGGVNNKNGKVLVDNFVHNSLE